MGDYISRQEAINTACTYIVEYCGAAFEEDMQNSLKPQLDSIPSADVREHVHNAWTGIDNFPHEVLECGHCGCIRILETAQDPWPNYCENCGADMRATEGERDV